MSSTFGQAKHDLSFQIFRGRDGRDCDLMTYATGEAAGEPATEAPTPVAAAAASEAAQMDTGSELKVLFDMPGFSLVRCWFKSGYPLPRHTHNVDCLYYITGGSLRMGDEVLGVGDGFFVGADVPYTYTPGDEGVEVLEIRPSNSFDIKVMGNAAALSEKFGGIMMGRQEAWAGETRPPLAR